MAGKRARTFNIVAILFCAGAVGAAAFYLVMRGDRTPPHDRETQKFMSKNCALPVYVKIGEHILLFPSVDGLYLRKKGEQLRTNCLKTTPHSPIRVDEIQTGLPFSIPGYENFGFWAQLRINGRSSQEKYQKMIDELKANNKEISDLPKDGNFHKYRYGKKYDVFRFFATSKNLIDFDGVPLMLSTCTGGLRSLSCTATFQWKDNISVSLLSPEINDKIEADIDIWEAIYPRAIEQLNNLEHRPDQSTPNTGDGR
jgi:hypothetical protein